MDQWEAEGKFPAHRIFKILGSAGFLGVNKSVGKISKIHYPIGIRAGEFVCPLMSLLDQYMQ